MNRRRFLFGAFVVGVAPSAARVEIRTIMHPENHRGEVYKWTFDDVGNLTGAELIMDPRA